MAEKQRKNDQQEISILLMHDAVYTPPTNLTRLFYCQDDVEARGIECTGKLVNYDEIVNLLIENDSIVSWPSL